MITFTFGKKGTTVLNFSVKCISFVKCLSDASEIINLAVDGFVLKNSLGNEWGGGLEA